MNANQDYMDLDTVLGGLPDIKLKNARRLLKETLQNLQSEFFADRGEFTDTGYVKRFCDRPAEDYTRNLRGVMVSLPEIEECLGEQDLEGAYTVTPAFASTLVELYRAGAFEMGQNMSPVEPHKELLDYVEYGQARIVEKRALEEQERHEFRAFVNNPETVPEAKFTYELLDRIFIGKLGLGRGIQTFMIGGIQVTKSVSTYRSNSGMSADNEVVFSWTSTLDGAYRTLEKHSRYRQNRSNNPE